MKGKISKLLDIGWLNLSRLLYCVLLLYIDAILIPLEWELIYSDLELFWNYLCVHIIIIIVYLAYRLMIYFLSSRLYFDFVKIILNLFFICQIFLKITI